MKQVLVLGAGRVARPMVSYLLSHGLSFTVADSDLNRAVQTAGVSASDVAVRLDVTNRQALAELVAAHQIVVSLLPYSLHASIARVCIDLGRHLVTTSYVKGEMEQLDSAARARGVLLLNEMGLDPGIDHMSAMQTISTIRRKGGRVVAFRSFCGALPAPEAADNPFGYRFSWSPRGVLQAGNSSARYLSDGKEVEIDPDRLFSDPLEVGFPGLGVLEVYPNRDSVAYAGLYGLETTPTVLRGTFRNVGWCRLMSGMKQMRLFSEEPGKWSGITYRQMVARLTGIDNRPDLEAKLAERFDGGAKLAEALGWLGLLSEEPIAVDESPFNLVADAMQSKMELKQGDRDMTVMQHQFDVEWPDGSKNIIYSRMLDFGDPAGDTSIARTVALPAATAARLILQNTIGLRGVQRPLAAEIYEPVLSELAELGICLTESIETA